MFGLRKKMPSPAAALPSHEPTPLPAKAIGFDGEIRALAGPSFLLERLRELGFVRGERVRLHGRAPLGEPYLVEARGAVMALRRAEAACLLV